MSQELTVPQRFSLVPANYDDAIKISRTLAASKLVPKDYQAQPENVFVAIAWGQELGLAPLQSLQNIAVINGRPAIWGDAALAVCMAHPDFEDIEEKIEGSGDSRIATCTIKRKGRTPVVRTFSVADAKKAGLWGKQGPWQQYPDRMQQLRARGFGLRDAFPDAMRGFRIAEEVQDIEPEKDVTPAKPAVVMPQASSAAPAASAVEVVAEVNQQAEQAVEAAQGGDQPASQPVQAADGVVAMSAGMLKTVRAKLQAAGIEERVVCLRFDVERLEAIAASQVNAVLDFIKAGGVSQ